MAISYIGDSIYLGSSADVKPTGSAVITGSLFIENNTGVIFYYDGAAWTGVGSSTGGDVVTISNVGTGAGLLVRDKVGTTVNVKSVKAGTNVTLGNNTDDVTINSSQPAATETTAGIVELGTSAETVAGLAVQTSDTRLTNARTPTTHDTTHHIDTIGSGTDITTNNATTTKHGLVPKGSGNAVEFLNGNLIWTTTPEGSLTPTSTHTLTNKTMSGASNTFTNIPYGTALSGVPTTFAPTAHRTNHTTGTDAFVKADVLIASSRYLENVADPTSDSGRIWINPTSEAIEYWDTLATPISRTVVNLTSTQTVTNKTVNLTNNTVTDTSTVLGDIAVSNGTKFVRKGRGTSLQVLRTNTGGTDIEWASLNSENTGTASATASGTTYNIAHGLGVTPSNAMVICSSHSTPAFTYTTTSTNIVVVFASTPTGTITFHWRAVA